MKHVVEVSKHFQNVHKAHGMLRERGGLLPQLPNDTRWSSQVACLETYVTNCSHYIAIRNEVALSGENDMPVNVGRIIDNISIQREAGRLLQIVKKFSTSLDTLQSDACTLADGVNIWLKLLQDEDLADHHNAIKKRFYQWIEPFMIIAYISSPTYKVH